jgi:hypothetical protein
MEGVYRPVQPVNLREDCEDRRPGTAVPYPYPGPALGSPAAGPEGVFWRPPGRSTVELLLSHFSRRLSNPCFTVKVRQEVVEDRDESPHPLLVC